MLSPNPKKNIYAQLRIMIKPPLTADSFRCTVIATKFAYFVGAIRKNSQPIIVRGVQFKRNSKHDKKGYLAIEIDPVVLFESKTDITKVQYNPNNRSGVVKFEIYQKDTKGNFKKVKVVGDNWFYEGEAPTILTWAVTQGINGTDVGTKKEQNIITQQTCPHVKDGAIEVAKYIVEEIKKNVKSLTAQRIRYHNTGEIGAELQKEFDKINQSINKITQQYGGGAIRYPVNSRSSGIALSLWIDMVDTDKPWDHKWQIRGNPKLNRLSGNTVHRRYNEKKKEGKVLPSHFHKYKDYDYFYDVWSNIHYGYVGLSVGFSEFTLLAGSSAQQLFNKTTKGVDTPDDVTAINIGFTLYKKFGTFAKNLNYQDVLDILDKTPLNQLPNSKHMHWCYNTNNPNRIEK